MVAGLAKRTLALLGLPVVLIVVWWATSKNGENIFWPPLTQVLSSFKETWLGARIRTDVLPSLLRLLAGYGCALVAGTVLGVVIGSFRPARLVLEPVLEFVRAIPPPVLIPPIMLVLGIGNSMKIAVIAVACMWPILLNCVEGVRGLDEVLSDTARCYQFRRRSRLLHLTLRGASPHIFVGARQALSIGVIIMVVSEMFAGVDGLGHSVVQFQRIFAISDMWSGVVLLGLIGVVLALVFRLIESWALAWYEGSHDSRH